MSRYYDFFCPVKLLAGEQALEQLASELTSLGAHRPLLLTDKGVNATGLATLLANVLAEGELPVAAIWDEIPADSSTAVVERIAKRYSELACDSLVALGGRLAARSSTPPRQSTFSLPWGGIICSTTRAPVA